MTLYVSSCAPRWKRRSLAATLLLGLLALPSAARAARYDDCDAPFIAFLGSDVYQFSPALPGSAGTVRLFTVLSHQGAAAQQDYGRALWRLEIRGPVGDAGRGSDRLVRAVEGSARIDFSGQATADFVWDGRDDQGRRVLPGTYQYTFRGRFLPDRLYPEKALAGYEDLKGLAGIAEAKASTYQVIVDYGLKEADVIRLRQSKAISACSHQQNTPIETGFHYNFYYGSGHSHSNWSDGGLPTTSCVSGNNGGGTFDPAAVYDYARNSAGVDYWIINEHNHLFDDAMTTNNPPVTEAKIKSRYASGLAAANSATVNDAFVALYGMEWGVLTNADQGHVTLIETPKLFGWETCSTCNGPSKECTTGTNCYFDVFTPKRFGYLTMYKTSVANPSAAGALGILCHPSTGQFDNFAFNADADQALQGIAVRSGLAFSTATNCAQANIASTDYSPLWQQALNLGFHLGPTADHDAHCNNFGLGLPDRTVYLLPNATSPVLTKLALMQAHKARHFFASEDSNAQLVFATSDGSHVMGDIFTSAGGASLRAAVYDPDGESVSSLQIWRGQIGGGVPTAAYRSVSNASTISLTETLSSGTYYYYVHAVQADGNDLWSAPMWITYGSGGGGGTSVNVGGWTLTQANSTATYTIPAGTTIPAGGYLVIGRDATQSAFQTFWGKTLPANALYLDSAGLMPVINGSETYRLNNASGTLVDGTTIAMPSAALSTVQRKDPCLAAGTSSSWTISASSNATPGSGAGAGCAKGVVINEFSDAAGTGNFIYEFIELHNDQ
jgi:hypothetical protein